MTIIEISAHSDKWHSIENQAWRTEVWAEGYIAVPKNLEAAVWECLGYCDLNIRNDLLIEITPYAPPPPPPPEPEPTETEVLRAQVAALQAELLRLRTGG